jgi:hypothetical protein
LSTANEGQILANGKKRLAVGGLEEPGIFPALPEESPPL